MAAAHAVYLFAITCDSPVNAGLTKTILFSKNLAETTLFLLAQKIETIFVDFRKYVVKIVDEPTVCYKVDRHGGVKSVTAAGLCYDCTK